MLNSGVIKFVKNKTLMNNSELTVFQNLSHDFGSFLNIFLPSFVYFPCTVKNHMKNQNPMQVIADKSHILKHIFLTLAAP